MAEHFYVKLGDPSCIGFWDIVWKNRQTNRQTDKHMNTAKNPTHAITVGIGNETEETSL